MNRRNALKNLAVGICLRYLAAGMDGIMRHQRNDTHHSGFNEKEQKTLASIADTIIPAGTSIGALTVGVDKYLQKFIDDCTEQPVQDNVKKQLKAINDASQKEEKLDFSGVLTATTRKTSLDVWRLTRQEPKRFFCTDKIRDHSRLQHLAKSNGRLFRLQSGTRLLSRMCARLTF